MMVESASRQNARAFASNVLANLANNVLFGRTAVKDHMPADEEFHISDWQKPQVVNGIEVANAFQEIQDFAYRAFEVMDRDSDGFVSREELNYFLSAKSTSLRAKSFIRFMLYRLDDIKNSFIEESNSQTDGISRDDIREYFDGYTPQG